MAIETVLVIAFVLTLAGSFWCSISEAALYSVPIAWVRPLAESGGRSGKILLRFKEEMDRPITAILVLSTICNSVGPALCGAIADTLWGPNGVIVVAGSLAVTILFIGEVTPKILGVMYARQIAPVVAAPLAAMVWMLKPMIWLSSHISAALKPDTEAPSVSHHEVISMAEIGTEEGALDPLEGEVIQNVIQLDEILLREVLTPRVVVFRLREDLTLAEVEKELPDWSHSRVPLYSENDPEHLSGYVLQRDAFRELLRGNRSLTLRELARPLPVVPELMKVDRLLVRMLDKREHICAVVDEHGGLAGIVTLEDVIEQLVGKEIVDEYDAVADLRSFANLLRVVRTKKSKDSVPTARQAAVERTIREARRPQGGSNPKSD